VLSLSSEPVAAPFLRGMVLIHFRCKHDAIKAEFESAC
jgi:hypothetical protein